MNYTSLKLPNWQVSSIPASTAHSERVFSQQKYTSVRKTMEPIFPEQLAKCIYLRHNAKWF